MMLLGEHRYDSVCVALFVCVVCFALSLISLLNWIGSIVSKSGAFFFSNFHMFVSV